MSDRVPWLLPTIPQGLCCTAWQATIHTTIKWVQRALDFKPPMIHCRSLMDSMLCNILRDSLTIYGHTCVPGPNISSHCLLTLYICPGSCWDKAYGLETGSSSRHSPYPVLMTHDKQMTLGKTKQTTDKQKKHSQWVTIDFLFAKNKVISILIKSVWNRKQMQANSN